MEVKSIIIKVSGMKKKLTKSIMVSGIAILILLTTGKNVIARTPKEIIRSGSIRIGICNDQPPVQFRKNNGELVGIDPDLGKMIAEALGVMPEWKEIKGGPKFRAETLIEKRVDIVISTLSITKERMEVINLSEPYFTTGLGLIIRADKKDLIKSYNDLDGRPVAVIKGTTGEKLLSGIGFDVRTILAPDSTALYEEIKKGNADAVIDDRIFLDHYTAGKKDVILLEDTLSADQYGIGINKEDTELTAFVNIFIENIRNNGRLEALVKRYVNKPENTVATETGEKGFTVYEIQPEDTLMGIARKFYNDATRWELLYSANSDSIKIVNILAPGLKIRIPNIRKDTSENISGSSSGIPVTRKSALESVMKRKPTRPPMVNNHKTVNQSSKIKEYDLNELENYNKKSR